MAQFYVCVLCFVFCMLLLLALIQFVKREKKKLFFLIRVSAQPETTTTIRFEKAELGFVIHIHLVYM